MHVEISGDPGKAPKHAGQKKTYKAVSTASPASCRLWLCGLSASHHPPTSTLLAVSLFHNSCCLLLNPSSSLSVSLPLLRASFLFERLGQRTTVCFQFLRLTQQPRCGPVGVHLRARPRADRDEQKTLSDVNERLPHMTEFTCSSKVFVFSYKRVKSLISKLRRIQINRSVSR